jgi:Uma2 family endonuclease
MSRSDAKDGTKTLDDWLALPEGSRFELIDGELVEKAPSTIEHGIAQTSTAGEVRGAFGSKLGGPRGPGGWWIATEVDIVLVGRGFRPDVLGWRRERMPTLPKERPVTIRPDWICEIVSDSNRATDTVVKLHRYHQGGVPFYWIVDQLQRTLTVYRHTNEGYLVALAAEEHEHVCAEPFQEIDLHVAVLLGDAA